MKKIVSLTLVFCFLFLTSFSYSNCEIYEYVFDEIRIVEALKFDFEVATEPVETSYLFGKAHAGDILTAYMGKLEMISTRTDESHIIIITDTNNNDILRWIVNNWSLNQLTNTVSMQFSSHIQIAPEFGVRKNFDIPLVQVGLIRNMDTSDCIFVDNANVNYPMIPSSYEFETGLDIVIAAHTEVGP